MRAHVCTGAQALGAGWGQCEGFPLGPRHAGPPAPLAGTGHVLQPLGTLGSDALAGGECGALAVGCVLRVCVPAGKRPLLHDRMKLAEPTWTWRLPQPPEAAAGPQTPGASPAWTSESAPGEPHWGPAWGRGETTGTT